MYYPRLKDLREDNDLSQMQISAMLHMKQNQYSRYERGERELPSYILKQICEIYNISADYILGFTNEPYPLPTKKRK